MIKLHDSGYKRLFSNKVILRQLLESFVHEEWIKDIDFRQLEAVEKSFISEEYRERESDLLVKVRLRRQEAYIYILLEFQSEVDQWMVLRLLNYVVQFYLSYVEAQPRVRRLPAVFPLLLYNGDRNWTAPEQLSAVLENPEIFGSYTPQFEYCKIVANQFSRDELLRIGNIVSTLFLAESSYDIELLGDQLLHLFETEKNKAAVSLFLNWFRQMSLHGRIAAADYETLEHVYRTKEEVSSMLATAIAKEKRRVFNEGKRDGERRGKRKGIQEQSQEVARRMIAKGFAPESIIEITGLSNRDLAKLNLTSRR